MPGSRGLAPLVSDICAIAKVVRRDRIYEVLSYGKLLSGGGSTETFRERDPKILSLEPGRLGLPLRSLRLRLNLNTSCQQ